MSKVNLLRIYSYYGLTARQGESLGCSYQNNRVKYDFSAIEHQNVLGISSLTEALLEDLYLSVNTILEHKKMKL
jgi:hypothetical protein